MSLETTVLVLGYFRVFVLQVTACVSLELTELSTAVDLSICKIYIPKKFQDVLDVY